MSKVAIKIQGLCKSYNVPVLQDFDFELTEGEVHALVGSNGAGDAFTGAFLAGLARGQGLAPAAEFANAAAALSTRGFGAIAPQTEIGPVKQRQITLRSNADATYSAGTVSHFSN